jgi:hypothetical protein
MSRLALQVPYLNAHERSLVRGLRRGVVPKGLNPLLSWYVAQWELEVPMRLHVPGTWHDPEAHTQLGSPQDDPAWRSYLYGSDDALDADGYYLRPLHAALLRVGRHVDRDGEYPFMAIFLVQLAFGRFDWEGVGAVHGMERGAAATYTKAALTHLWERWTPQPLVR